jgi:exopolyphosphatase / guanosine-5'-triphosphate,3'-diphosphate pyrophosphatase
MPLAMDTDASAAKDAADRIAVIDIGSNSIRIVAYDGVKRAPLPILNEKVQCALGKGLSRTGRLNPDGVMSALANLQRFRRLAEGLGIERVEVLATAAVREASDGEDFIRQVERVAGFKVQVVAGEEEARLAAQGVLFGSPRAEGLIGDMGGGSVELVGLRERTAQRQVTLPLGPFRLAEVGSPRHPFVAEFVDQQFKSLPWLPDCARGRDFYPVGGNWRAIARLHMEETGHPLHIIHHYVMKPAEAAEYAGRLARANRSVIDKLAGAARRRDTIQLAALVFERLLLIAQPERVVFSAYGLREGFIYGLLSEAERGRDPLLAACGDLAVRMGRADGCELLRGWTDGLFPGEAANRRRLREAACLLSEIAWAEHPDYRAEHAFMRVLRFPFPGIDHGERVFLAMAIHARYAGDLNGARLDAVRGMLSPQQTDRALALGLALRLAHTLSGGAPRLLAPALLTCNDEELLLTLPDGVGVLSGEVVERRMRALAQAFGRRPRVISAPLE